MLRLLLTVIILSSLSFSANAKGLNESPRGDSRKNSMERARENPQGSSNKKPVNSITSDTKKKLNELDTQMKLQNLKNKVKK